MKLYGKFKSNMSKGDYVSFDTHSDCMFRVLNKSKDGKHILVYENKTVRWKWFNDVVAVWGVSNE